jgi:predicted MFS family arabinose efflux permease
VAHPMLRPALLRNRRRVGSLLVIALLFGAQLSMFFLSVQYVQQVLGYGPLAAGFAFLPLTVGIFAVSRFTPRLVARYGPVRLQLVGLLGLVASFVWISQAGAGDTYATAILGPMLLNGVAAGLTFMPTTVLALSDVEPEHAGAASGLMQTMQQLGGAVGLAVIASVYAAGAVPGEFVPGAEAAFLTSALLTLLAALAVVTLVRRPNRVG